jgi:methyl-accepting chemotaxis protein
VTKNGNMKKILRKWFLSWQTLGIYMLVGGAPLFLAVVFAVILGVQRLNEVREIGRLEQVVETVEEASNLVLELQRERSRTIIYLETSGNRGKEEMLSQRSVVDAAVQAFAEVDRNVSDRELSSQILQVSRNVQSLSDLRGKIDLRVVNSTMVAEEFAHFNASLIDIADYAARAMTSGETSRILESLNDFLRAQEAASEEKTVAEKIYLQKSFAHDDFQRLIELRTLVHVGLNRMTSSPFPALAAHGSAILVSQEYQDVAEIQAKAIAWDFSTPLEDVTAAYDAGMTLMTHHIQQTWDMLDTVVAESKAEANRNLWLVVIISALLIAFVGRLIYMMAWTVQNVLGEVVRGALQMIEGNLDVTFPKVGNNGISTLIKSVAIFRDTIRETRDADAIRAQREKDQLDQLVARTEQSKARSERISTDLENTAQTVEELANSVSSSLKTTEMANSFANEMQLSANEGNTIVQNAIAAMDRIRAASDKITSIIKIIDEIAFQTNLLALNARVEAARAGHVGRGFAVVATEVQQLAARSARAASDVSELIEQSANEVRKGASIVETSGVTLAEIAYGATEIAGLIDTITEMSRQQSRSLNEISAATGRLDDEMQGLAREFTES